MSGREAERVGEPPGLAPRARDSHKGTYGRVLIVAGSRTMPGAAILAARAALRSGAGLVTAAIPEAIGCALAAAVPEATQIHVPEPSGEGDRAELGQALLSRLASG
ncbi:MAG: NAD(P)H-hydrate dehydratase, partial [Planctomycetota bacterium]